MNNDIESNVLLDFQNLLNKNDFNSDYEKFSKIMSFILSANDNVLDCLNMLLDNDEMKLYLYKDFDVSDKNYIGIGANYQFVLHEFNLKLICNKLYDKDNSNDLFDFLIRYSEDSFLKYTLKNSGFVDIIKLLPEKQIEFFDKCLDSPKIIEILNVPEYQFEQIFDYLYSVDSNLNLEYFYNVVKKYFKNSSSYFDNNFNYIDLFIKYYLYKLLHIDKNTFYKVLGFVKKSREELLDILFSNDYENFQSCISYITELDEEMNFEDELLIFDDVQKIYKKTRYKDMPSIDIISILKRGNNIDNFDLKIWNKFKSFNIFNDENNLAHFINVFDLFNRKNDNKYITDICNKILNLIPFITKENFIELSTNLQTNVNLISKIEKETVNTIYKLRDGVQLPEEIMGINYYYGTTGFLTKELIGKIKKLKGTVGKKMTDFLSPYAFISGKKYVLKNEDLVPPELKNILTKELSIEKYNELLNDPECAKFLMPFQEVDVEGYTLNSDCFNVFLSHSYQSEKPVESFVEPVLFEKMISSIDNNYNRYFSNFLLENLSSILVSDFLRTNICDLKKIFPNIVDVLKRQGKSKIEFFDVLEYFCMYKQDVANMDSDLLNLFNRSRGNESRSSNNFYLGLYEKYGKRKKTSIPIYDKVTPFYDDYGNEYKIEVKILRHDDPFALVVGEKNYTNCCYSYGNTGENCLKHSMMDDNGGVVVTYLIENGIKRMLSQSWLWCNDEKLCLDNIEGTDLLKHELVYDGDFQRNFSIALKSFAKDVVDNSEIEADKYYNNALKNLRYLDLESSDKRALSSMTDSQKDIYLSLLEKEQKMLTENIQYLADKKKIKFVAVGESFSDFDVDRYFKKRIITRYKEFPKGYEHIYTDSSSRSGLYLIYSDPNYQVPIISDFDIDDKFDLSDLKNNEVVKTVGLDITKKDLDQIFEIESLRRDESLKRYSENNISSLNTVEDLAKYYNVAVENLNICIGKDWYIVYFQDKKSIKILDVCRGLPNTDCKHVFDDSFVSALNKIIMLKINMENLYIDNRNIFIENGKNIHNFTLKKLFDIQNKAIVKRSSNYLDDAFTSPAEIISNFYNCNLSDLYVIVGEDWYIIYTDDGSKIDIVDSANTVPVRSSEYANQNSEMLQAFNMILKSSVILDAYGDVQKIKSIHCNFDENSTYQFYKVQNERNIVETIEDEPILNEDENILDYIKNDRTLGNLHSVKFKPTDRLIEKIKRDRLVVTKSNQFLIED